MEFAFISTNTAGGWKKWRLNGIEIGDGGISLKEDSVPTYVRRRRIVNEMPLGLRVVDTDVDACENLYLLGSSRKIYRYEQDRRVLSRLPGVERVGKEPRALCVGTNTLFVADGTGSVHAISRRSRRTTTIVNARFENPVGMIKDGETIYVLDRGSNRRESGSLTAVRSGEEPTAVATGLQSPRDIARDARGNVYVLNAPKRNGDRESEPAIVKIDADALSDFDDTDAAEPLDPSELIRSESFRVKNTSVTFSPSCIEVADEDQVIVGVDPESRGEKTLFRYLPESEAFERLAGFKRSCAGLSIQDGRVRGKTGGIYAIDGNEREVHFLERTTRNELSDGKSRSTQPYRAEAVRRFDSGSPGTRWHRVAMDSTLEGTNTQVRLSYYATDDESIDYITDDESSEEENTGDGDESSKEKSLNESKWKPLPRPNPRDALLESAEGRYLWVRIELRGSEYASPRVRSLRVYLPQSSYLRYLPAIYQEDDKSEDFLKRFLSLFETVFVDIEEEIEGITTYLDPNGIPSEHLSWLGNWLAIETDETWSEPAKREIIDKAPELFKKRGTRSGLLEILEVYLKHSHVSTASWDEAREREGETLDELVAEGYMTREEANEQRESHEARAASAAERSSPYLLEYADLDCIDETDTDARKSYTELLPCPQCFLVLVEPFVDEQRMGTIERIVESETPAHAVGRAVELQPWIELGGNCYLGVNSILPRRELVLERASLGRDTVLVEGEGSRWGGSRAGANEKAT